MRKITKFKKSTQLLLALLAFLAGGASPAWADELTVYDGTATNEYIPLYGYYADTQGGISEFIIPSSELTALNGKAISQMSFYLSSPATSLWGVASFNVYLEEVGGSNYDDSSASQLTESKTLVYAGALDGTGSTMEIPFSNNYTYNGGNLLVAIEVGTKGTYKAAKFYGTTTTSNSSRYKYSSTGRAKFIPKTTFTYETISAYKKPATLTYTSVTSNSTVINWTAGSSDGSETGWDLEYKTSSSDTWTEVHGLDASILTYSLTSLEANTSYDVRVQALYGENESGWKSTTFQTLRAPISSFPWSEDFTGLTSGNIPDGWDNAEGTTTSASYKWTYYNDGHNASPCLRFDSYNNSNNNTNFLKTPVMNFTQGAPMQLKFWYKNPTGGDFSVYISNDGGATHTTELVTGLTGASSWTEKVIDIPTDEFFENVVIVFKGTSNYGSGDARIYLDDVIVKEKSDSEPNLAVTPDEDAAFGTITAEVNKTYTVTNTGTGLLTVNITSDDAKFTVAPAQLSDIAAGESKTFTVTFTPAAETYGKFNANIMVSPTYDAEATVIIAASAKVKDPNVWSEDFSGNTLPDGWEITNGTYWKIQDKMLKGSYSYGNYDLVTPSLIVEDGQTLSFDYRMTSTYRSLEIQYSKDNGAWTDYNPISYSGLTPNEWYTYTISGLEAGKYKFRFSDSNYDLDNFEGFNLNPNDPKMAVYSDAEATQAVTSGTAKDFGWVIGSSVVEYFIKNIGTGTLTITDISTPDGFRVDTDQDRMSVTAGDIPLALYICMENIENPGMQSGTVTITTNCGVFTIPVSGMIRNADKFFIDFSEEGAKFPAGWSTGNWTITNGYAASGSTSTDLQTTTFQAAPGERLVIEAVSTTTSYYNTPTLTYSYSTDGGSTWTVAESVTAYSDLSTYQTVELGTPNDADECNVLVKFTGQYVAIRRIYGFTTALEPIMTTTAADMAFGMQTAASEEQSFTISNEGSAPLEELSVTLGKTNAGDYRITSMKIGDEDFSGTELLAGQTITVSVKQNYDINNLGAKSDVLTISAKGQTTVTINLTGATRDASKFYADFEDGNMPAGWTKNTWSVTTTSGNKVAYAGFTASALISTPMIVAENETLTFKAARQYSSSAPTLQVRYTTDGGVTWSEYTDYAAQVTSSDFTTIEVTGIPAGTVVYEIYGRYFYLDEISGFAPTTAPLFALTTSETLTGDKYDFGQSLQAAPADKVFTITNNGNAALVSDIAANGDVEIALSGDDVTINGSQVTVPAGKTATLTVSLTFDASNAGAKTGSVTIDSNDPVADVTLNFTANVLDATAVNIDFANNSKPAGFYSNGWTYSSGYAANTGATEAELITSKLTVADPSDVLSYQARTYNKNWYDGSLTVQYSTDRKNWTDVATQPSDLNDSFQTFTVSGLKNGDYYLRFAGARVYVDNIMGWHYATPAAEHDFYLSAATFPTTTLIPETENGVTASATVYSLAADETDVYAKLFFGETEMATAAAQNISKDGNAIFNFTANVPTAEQTYAAKVIVYNSADEVVWETATTDVTVAHTRTLSITALALGEGQEATATANASNQFTAKFDVTVENTGTIAVMPTVKIFNGETLVGQATATETLAKEASTTITVTAENISAGEGGDLSFTTKAYIGEAEFAYATPVVINVTAAAPKFDLAVKNGAAVADGDAVAFGLVKEATTKTYTITNSGNQDLVLVSIVTPEGYEATELTATNKTISVNSTLDIDVTLKAEQGKVAGNLVITYKVDASTNNTFTLALSGRSISADTWTVDFEDGQIPADWDNSNGWTAYQTDGNYVIRLSGWDAKSIMTPRLAAEKDEVLTFDVLSLGNSITYAYSTDKETWSDEVTINATGEQTFTAPAADNYYLRFTGRNAYLDNFVGFKLNPLEHDTEIAASSVPATGKQYNVYTATVTLKESVGKAEEVTASLYVGGEVKATETQSITANGSTVVTLTWEPQEVISEAVNAYVAVAITDTDIDLATEPVSLTIAEVYTLDEETSASTVDAVSDETVLLKRKFVAGWNTVCLPFAINDVEAYFGEGAKAYDFTAYNTTNSELSFSIVSTLSASYPYLVYVPQAITEPMKLQGITISSYNDSGFSRTSNGVTFQGTYAPMDEGSLTGMHVVGTNEVGVTKLYKATASAWMKGFRAYFKVPDGLQVKSLSFFDEATGVRTISAGSEEAEAIFDLMGRRMNEARKGVNIVNGKKVIIK